jgi:Fic/DOC family
MIFQERTVPADCRLVGWSWIVQEYALAAPVRQPSCVAYQHVSGSQRIDDDWRVFDKRYWPGETLAAQLGFALRHENLDLLILKQALEAATTSELQALVRDTPTSTTSRRIWYFYEILTGRTLEVDDAPPATAIDLLDTEVYFTGKPRLSRRHRVRDNLLGTGRFCAVIRRTDALRELSALDLSGKAKELIGRTGAHLVSRAASFLLLADSRASFEIEGERPPKNRLERWARAILQAGKYPLTIDEMIRLQRVLIDDSRFVHVGLRSDGVFVGERDHNRDPMPEFIGARPTDLTDLLNALVEANNRMREDGVDPVLKAAATAFGFVYIHPFEDGNGRLHRFLIHHVLAERKFTPPGLVFPVSSVMLERIEAYRQTLQAHSAPLMPFIDWRPTPEHNVEVLNDTGSMYRYFDCTLAAEFLYSCVQRTVDEDLPREIEYLRGHDEAMRRIQEVVEMPNRLAEDLIIFIRQNQGRLPKRRREGQFVKLTDREVASLEAIVTEAFETDK